MASLRVISGPLAGEVIVVDRTLTVGRQQTDVVIDDPELSRRHLEVRPEADGLVVDDLGSTNGTFVGDRQIDAPTRLRDGDRVTLGVSVLEVQIAAAQEETRARAHGEPDLTRFRSVPDEVLKPASSHDPPQALAAPLESPPAAVVPLSVEVGAFLPPSVRRGGGLASRSWLPVALSFGTALLTALALVIYFAQR